jgi:hypothetical protein
VYDFAIYQNPKYFSCTLDEDVIGRIKRVTKHTHPSTMSIRTLEHYAVFASQVWVGDLAAQLKKKKNGKGYLHFMGRQFLRVPA